MRLFVRDMPAVLVIIEEALEAESGNDGGLMGLDFKGPPAVERGFCAEVAQEVIPGCWEDGVPFEENSRFAKSDLVVEVMVDLLASTPFALSLALPNIVVVSRDKVVDAKTAKSKPGDRREEGNCRDNLEPIREGESERICDEGESEGSRIGTRVIPAFIQKGNLVGDILDAWAE
ncbi:hypothetical protein GQX73_g10876 [Xylaria multiplex]|uniref:Uncharacterized protein n=1 Tax=Xylaria multiplex TaxID=323545 RepID=A0A7C8MZD5_9PEZI|nr:hypothetical protein GQX73_g10876 [Xylaria multiplex]